MRRRMRMLSSLLAIGSISCAAGARSWNKALTTPAPVTHRFAELSVVRDESAAATLDGPSLMAQVGPKGSSSLVVSPDGRWFATVGTRSDTIQVWDAATGRLVRRLRGHTGEVAGLAGADERRLVSAGKTDGAVLTWDVVTGHELQRLDVGEQRIHGVAVDARLRRVAVGRAGTTRLQVYALDSAELLFAGPEENVFGYGNGPSMSADGRRVALVDSAVDRTRVFDVDAGREIFSVEFDGRVSRLSADGRFLAVAGLVLQDDGKTRAFDLQRKVELPLAGATGYGFNAVLSSDGSKLAGVGRKSQRVRIWSLPSGEVLRDVDQVVDRPGAMGFTGPGGSELLVATGSIHRYALTDGRLLDSYGTTTELGGRLRFVQGGQRLFTGPGQLFATSEPLYALDLNLGVQDGQVSGVPGSQNGNHWDVSADGRLVAQSFGDGQVLVRVVATGETVFEDTLGEQGINSLAFDPQGRYLAAATFSSKVAIWDLASKRRLALRSVPGSSYLSMCDLEFSPRGGSLALGTMKAVLVYAVPSLRVERQIRVSEFRHLAYSPDGSRLLVEDGNWLGQRVFRVFTVADGEQVAALEDVKGKSLLNAFSTAAFTSRSDTIAYARDDGTIQLWTIGADTRRELVGHDGLVTDMASSAELSILASAGGSDGTIRLWRLPGGEPLAVLTSSEEGWLATHPSGLFDGSPGAWKQIAWRFGDDLFDSLPAEAFFNEFYTPGLLADLVDGRSVRAPRVLTTLDRKQPILRFVAPQERDVERRRYAVRLEVEPGREGGAVRDVRLFRNGTLVKLWPGEVVRPGQMSATLETELTAVAGINQLTAYAFNADNIKSQDAQLRLKGAERLRRKPTAHILAVGIDDYDNDAFDLRYARADAELFAQDVQRAQRATGRFGDIRVEALYDGSATREGILGKLGELGSASVVQAEDAVFIYFAGHGIAVEDRFYLLPRDLDYGGALETEDGAVEQLVARGISDRELERLLTPVEARSLVLVIDACNSGQALEAKEKRRGPMNSRGLAQLAYEKGMNVVTAAQAYQLAVETSALGHGFLTWALVKEGLDEGRADVRPRDGRILAREWLDFAARRVPDLHANTLDGGTRGLKVKLGSNEPHTSRDRAATLQRPRVFYRRFDTNELLVGVNEDGGPR